MPVLVADPGELDSGDQHDWDAELTGAVTGRLSDHGGVFPMRHQEDTIAAALAAVSDAHARPSAWAPLWVPLLDPQRFSGHKLHVTTDDLTQVRAAVQRVFPICHQAGLGLKAAGRAETLERNGGKGLAIYLTRRSTIHRDTSMLAGALDGYRSRQTTIYGDTKLTDVLHHRYEFFRDPGADVYSRHAYHELYKPSLQALRDHHALTH